MTYKLEVRKKYNEVAKIMNIEPPTLKFSRSNKKNALANTKKITIEKGLATLIFQDPELVETLIAHELTHYENQDPRIMKKNMYRLFSKKINGYNLIFELRASIGGYTLNGMKSEEEILEIEKRFKTEEKYISDKKACYKIGYPTAEQIAYYASRNNSLSKKVAEEILRDFCEEMGVKDAEEFIEDVLKVTMK